MTIFVALSTLAAEVQQVTVTHTGPRYRIVMQTTLAALPERAQQVFSDYRKLPLINPAVISAQVLGENADGSQRLATELHMCFAFFCRDLKQVQDIHATRDGDSRGLSATVLPALSDLRYGQADWTLRPCGAGTCLGFTAELEPDFWVPPLIGPWLMERKLREEALTTSQGIERLAQATP
jgi:hypothetical protein